MTEVDRLLAFARGGPMVWRQGETTDYNALRADILAALATPQPAEARGIVEALIEEINRQAFCNGSVNKEAAYRASAALSATLSPQVPSSDEMVAFGASDAACYLYPGEDQAKERAAFCDGASRYASPQAGGGEGFAYKDEYGRYCWQETSPPADNAGLVEELEEAIAVHEGHCVGYVSFDTAVAYRILSALRANGAERQSRASDCPSSPDGRHQVDTSMESGPNNCFYCEQSMAHLTPPNGAEQ